VVLARRLGVRLVTNDRDVLKSFPGLAVSLEAYRD
jgi:predicted nucleic acid-binding protein